MVPPNVNASGVNFSVQNENIVFALSAIKGCGGSAADAIVAERKQGAFRDLYDFCERIEPAQCNRATIETLIKAGAMDSLGPTRAQLLAGLDRAMQSGATAQADRRSGQMNLFGDTRQTETSAAGDLPDVAELEPRQRLAMEKEVLGFYLDNHPLEEYQDKLRSFCSHTTGQLATLADRQEVVLGGMVSAVKFAHVKRSRDPSAATKYVMFDLEDMEGSIRCIQWPSEFAESGALIQSDAILVIRGTIDRRGDEPNLIAAEVIPLEQLDRRFLTGIRLVVNAARRRWARKTVRNSARLPRFMHPAAVVTVGGRYGGSRQIAAIADRARCGIEVASGRTARRRLRASHRPAPGTTRVAQGH